MFSLIASESELHILYHHYIFIELRDDYPLGLQSDSISLGQLVASSFTTISGTARVADHARLDNAHKWCPDISSDSSPWLQV